jgi:DNA primase
MNTKKCLICKRPNNTLHWHTDPDTGDIWVWCNGKCQRGYSLRSYCHTAGVDLNDFLAGDFDFQEATPNEVSRLDWPHSYVSLSDPRAEKGVEYIKSRGLEVKGDMYYDLESEAIVFPYYFSSVFVGAQTRLMKPWINKDGEETKMLTMPGTRLGLVFYNWNQDPFVTNVQGIVVCEGAFNVLSIQQSLNKVYGGVLNNPFKVVATSGCGTTKHQMDKLKELKDAGKKVIVAFDSDEPGLKGVKKMIEAGVATHHALTGDTAIDWNDILKESGPEETARIFMKSITKI